MQCLTKELLADERGDGGSAESLHDPEHLAARTGVVPALLQPLAEPRTGESHASSAHATYQCFAGSSTPGERCCALRTDLVRIRSWHEHRRPSARRMVLGSRGGSPHRTRHGHRLGRHQGRGCRRPRGCLGRAGGAQRHLLVPGHRRLAHGAQHRRSGTGETRSRSAPTSDRRSGGIDCRRGSDHARLWLLDADDTARYRRSPTAKGPAAQTVSRVTPHRRGPGDRDVVDDAPPSDQNPTAGRKVRTDLSSRRDAQPGSAPRPRAGCAPGPWCRARAL